MFAFALTLAAYAQDPSWTADGAPLLPVLPDLPFVVLATGVPASWSDPLAPVHRPSFPDDPHALAAAPARLPKGRTGKRLGAWVGRTLHVVGQDGAACATTVTGLEVISRMTWMDGYANEALLVCPGAGCDEVLMAEMAALSDERLLVGRLTTTCGVSELPRVARAEPFAASAFVEPVSDRRKEKARTLLTALPAWEQVAATWMTDAMRAAGGDPEAVVEPFATVAGEPLVLQTELGNVRYVYAGAATGLCMGDEAAGAWGLWRVERSDDSAEGTRGWHLITSGTTDGSLPWPLLATDVDADGIPEWLESDGLWWATRFTQPDLLPRVTFPQPWMGCGC